jgi:hypothetical protein
MMFNLQNCALKVFFLFFHILSLNRFSLQHPSIGAAAAAHHRQRPPLQLTTAPRRPGSPYRFVPGLSLRAFCAARRGAQARGPCAARPRVPILASINPSSLPST